MKKTAKNHANNKYDSAFYWDNMIGHCSIDLYKSDHNMLLLMDDKKVSLPTIPSGEIMSLTNKFPVTATIIFTSSGYIETSTLNNQYGAKPISRDDRSPIKSFLESDGDDIILSQETTNQLFTTFLYRIQAISYYDLKQG